MKGLIITILCCCCGFMTMSQNADSLSNTGEIRSAEVVIEKERRIELPSASRLFQTTEVKEISKEPPLVSFSIRVPRVTLPRYIPSFQTQSLEKGSKEENYANEAILGFGNYLSPLLSFTHFSEQEQWLIGASLFHESFLEGPVRNENSGSSLTQLGFRLSRSFDNSKFFFAPQFNRVGYYFYGISDEAFANPAPQTLTDRIRTQDFQFNFGLSGRGMDDRFNYHFSPRVSFVGSAVTGNSSFASEFNLDIDAGLDYSMDQTNQVGFDFQTLVNAYESGLSQDRSVYSFEPWYRTKVKTIDFKIGLQANAINDSINKSQVGATMHLSVPFANVWRIEGGLDNRIRFNRLLDLYPQNPYLEDSLTLRTSVVKVPFYATIKGTVLPNLEVSAGVEIQDIENAVYFEPSLVDSARFMVDYDTAELNIFKYHFGIDYILDQSFEVRAAFSVFEYSPGSEAEAWYRPKNIFDLTAIKRFDKWLLTTRLKVVNGILAPAPEDTRIIELDGFSDLSIKVDYRINDQSAVFLQGDNLLNQSYAYFLNYQTRGLAVKGGFRYRF